MHKDYRMRKGFPGIFLGRIMQVVRKSQPPRRFGLRGRDGAMREDRQNAPLVMTTQKAGSRETRTHLTADEFSVSGNPTTVSLD